MRGATKGRCCPQPFFPLTTAADPDPRSPTTAPTFIGGEVLLHYIGINSTRIKALRPLLGPGEKKTEGQMYTTLSENIITILFKHKYTNCHYISVHMHPLQKKTVGVVLPNRLLLLWAIVFRTHDVRKNPYIPLFLHTILGPDYYDVICIRVILEAIVIGTHVAP